MSHEQTSMSESTRAIMESMKDAVAKELDRKRRLGHYAVFWEDGKVVLKGDDAPSSQKPYR
ncbi:hypothetical protein [Marinospirillum sp.]|uniref:hypothetical protein n=1 Tax=Marinospirillum sp. TaxID=2183934 RepID=UPI0028708F54|nr:hypothetical protein [Marinospirillum sp.]MDR9468169.1 hypothetical protein [Marinospirillum sp.]